MYICNVQVLKGWSLQDPKYENYTTLLKQKCHHDHSSPPLVAEGGSDDHSDLVCEQSGYLMAGWGLPDLVMGLILLVFSLFVLCLCLVVLVKLLNSLMQDQMADVIRKFLNADIPYVPWLTGYIAIVIGAVITFLVQSSSVFTSTLTPLAGTGLFTLERAYPLTLGSNIGTTTTGLLAAFAADPDRLQYSLQIALCHLLFNITGIAIFSPIPVMRWPLPLAHVMGATVAKYR